MIPSSPSEAEVLRIVEGEFDAGTVPPGQNLIALVPYDLKPGEAAIPTVIRKDYPSGVGVFSIWFQGMAFSPALTQAVFLARNPNAFPVPVGVVRYAITVYKIGALLK